jgi:hypothetical protein
MNKMPRVTPNLSQRTLERLCDAGVIKKTKDGRYIGIGDAVDLACDIYLDRLAQATHRRFGP